MEDRMRDEFRCSTKHRWILQVMVIIQICFPIAVGSKLLLFSFHHPNEEKEDNEYDKVIHWILKDGQL